jgi:phosphate transport system substrate-binding protein
MALIDCPECKKQISNHAVVCPHCGMPLVCPECGHKHVPLEAPALNLPRPSRRHLITAVVFASSLVAWSLVAFGLWKYFQVQSDELRAVSASPVPAHAVPATPESVLPAAPMPSTAGSPETAAPQPTLSFAGSEVLGSNLVPSLAEAFLKHEGALDVRRIDDPSGRQIVVEGVVGATVRNIRISAQGSHTAFETLAEGRADIGMAAREITYEEHLRLRLLANMAESLKEAPLALDGIAIIVNPANPLSELSRDQIAAIYSGLITDWLQVNQSAGRINVCIPDDKDDTFDAFSTEVLGNIALTTDAQRFRDASEVAAAVLRDRAGIGLVSMSSIGNAKAIAISVPGRTAVSPDQPSVAAGYYPFARRLYLYSFSGQNNAHVRKFLEYVGSEEARALIKHTGFVTLDMKTEEPGLAESVDTIPYAQYTAEALRLSFDVRFSAASATLDDTARHTIQRAVDFLSSLGSETPRVMLFGFSDSKGDDLFNLQISKQRAEVVANELSQRGIKPSVITGLGSTQPVASNDTGRGRSQNRRVEIWLKKNSP